MEPMGKGPKLQLPTPFWLLCSEELGLHGHCREHINYLAI